MTHRDRNRGVDGPSRLRRHWVRAALSLGLSGLAIVGSAQVLLGPEPALVPPARSRARKAPPPPPLAAHQLGPGASAAALASARTPEAKVMALRDLERHDPSLAAAEARKLLTDPLPFVRVNAVAVLARSGDPAAEVTLASTTPTPLPDPNKTYEIDDGVRRAKAADRKGNPTIEAVVFDDQGRRVAQGPVKVDALLSPHKDTIEIGSPAGKRRWDDVVQGTNAPNPNNPIPPIFVREGSQGTPIRDVDFDPPLAGP